MLKKFIASIIRCTAGMKSLAGVRLFKLVIFTVILLNVQVLQGIHCEHVCVAFVYVRSVMFCAVVSEDKGSHGKARPGLDRLWYCLDLFDILYL